MALTYWTSAVSKCANATGHHPLWDKVRFIDCDPHWYTCRVKEAIHMRLHPNDINRDNGIEIPEAYDQTAQQPIGTAADCTGNVQHLIRTMGIKILQPQPTRTKIHQSQTAMVLNIVTHTQLTTSPDEDQQKVVETSRST